MMKMQRNSIHFSSAIRPHSHPLLALREGEVAGVEGGPAPKERCLLPLGRQKEDGAGGHSVLACK